MPDTGCYRSSKSTKSESKSQLSFLPSGSAPVVTGLAKVQNLKANHNEYQYAKDAASVVTGLAKVQNLKANHNRLSWIRFCALVVTGLAKVQNLKANHN